MPDAAPLRDRLNRDLKEAMRARDEARLSPIRMLKAAILEREKSGEGEASDQDLVAIVRRQAKQRRDSIRQFTDAGRTDLADRERAELAVIEGYLPAQASDEAIRAAATEAAHRLGLASPRDAGRLTGETMKALEGQADGTRVKAVALAVLEERGGEG